MRPTGIHSFGLRYWSAALSADVGRSDQRLLVKYDPRDMARFFVRRPSGNFVEARYADLTLPSITRRDAVTKKSATARRGIASSKSKVDDRGWARSAASTPANLFPLLRIQVELE